MTESRLELLCGGTGVGGWMRRGERKPSTRIGKFSDVWCLDCGRDLMHVCIGLAKKFIWVPFCGLSFHFVYGFLCCAKASKCSHFIYFYIYFHYSRNILPLNYCFTKLSLKSYKRRSYEQKYIYTDFIYLITFINGFYFLKWS